MDTKEEVAQGQVVGQQGARIYRRLTSLGSSRFFLSVLYAGMQRPLFSRTEECIGFVNRVQTEAQRKDGCLQKVLFVAKTSKSFSQGGVVFIGAHIPTANMHAWVIEAGAQPDPTDRAWINYRPLLAISSK